MKNILKKTVRGIYNTTVIVALIPLALIAYVVIGIHWLYKWAFGEEDYYDNDL